MAKKSKSKKKEKKEEKVVKKHSRVKDPIYIGLAALAVLLAFSTYFYASGDCPTGGVVTPPVNDTPVNDSPLIIYEYSDFQCPFCTRVLPTLDQLKEEYGDEIEIEFRQFPLSFHKQAQKAAEAAECARDQDKFWEMHDTLFANQKNLGIDSLRQYAEDIGLDMDQFNSCLDSGEKAEVVSAHRKEGSERGITGTPAFIIGDIKVSGAQDYEVFKKAVDMALERGF